MIIETIMTLLYNVFISNLPETVINTNSITSAMAYVAPYIKSICYYLPISTISSILTITMALLTLRIAIAILKTIWACLPIL